MIHAERQALALRRAELQHQIVLTHRHIRRLQGELEALHVELEELEMAAYELRWIERPTSLDDYRRGRA